MNTENLTPRQRRLHELIESPRVRARWAPRSRRRLLVAALAGVTLLSAALFAASLVMDGPTAFVPFVGFLALAGLAIYLSVHLNVAARWAIGHPGLDEFQRAEMDRAALAGHSLTTSLLSVLLAVASAMGGAMLSLDLSGVLVLTTLLPLIQLITVCHGAYPAAYLAWTRPDELLDDEDDVVLP